MLNTGPACKVSIYVTDAATYHGVSSSTAILDFLFRSGVAGATEFKGVGGFGAHHHLHTTASFYVADHLPVVVQFIDTRSKVDELMPTLIEMAGTGIIEMQEATILKATQPR